MNNMTPIVCLVLMLVVGTEARQCFRTCLTEPRLRAQLVQQICPEIDNCNPNPCENSGTYNDDGSCTCTEGFKGDTCGEIDNCNPNPCENSGTYNDDGSCTCTEGFKGDTCGEIDNCNPNPCENNGTCNDDGSCTCTEGFKGDTCGEIDNCNPDPCENNGTCNDDGSCTCTEGFTGATCGVNRCEGVNCGDNGVCDLNDGTCTCEPGFSGAQCTPRTCSPRRTGRAIQTLRPNSELANLPNTSIDDCEDACIMNADCVAYRSSTSNSCVLYNSNVSPVVFTSVSIFTSTVCS